MATAARIEHKQIIGLDLLRFAAAMLVMLYHFGFWLVVEKHPIIGSGNGAMGRAVEKVSIFPFSSYGWMGVQIFFVISGFVIAYTANGSSVAQYLKSRVVRLLPAAWICASITATLYLFSHMFAVPVVIEAWARSVTLFPTGPWIDRVYWTLPIEVAFYIAILGLLATNAMNKAEAIFTGVGVTSATLWLLLFSLHHFQWFFDPWMTSTGRGDLTVYLEIFLYNRLAEFFQFTYGCFFATGLLLWVATRWGFTFRRVAALGFITLGSLANIIETTRLNDQFNEPSGPAIGIYLAALAILVLAVKLNRFVPSNRIVREIGLMTYPSYLIHNVVGCFLMGHLFLNFVPLRIAAVMALVVCLAMVVLIIRPLERWLQGQFRKAIGAAPEAWRKLVEFTRQPTTVLE